MPDFTPRPTLYKGIQMRSRLEAGYAQWLDSWDVDWTYEPQAFASEAGQYLPDFVLRGVATLSAGRVGYDEGDIYVEVKPPNFADLDGLARRMDIIHASQPSAALVLERPEHQPLLLSSAAISGVRWWPLAWVYDSSHSTSTEFKERLVLVNALHPRLAAWPPGYWKGPGA